MYRNNVLVGATFNVSTTAATYDIPDVTLADGDRLSITVSAPATSPKNMTISLFVDYTV